MTFELHESFLFDTLCVACVDSGAKKYITIHRQSVNASWNLY